MSRSLLPVLLLIVACKGDGEPAPWEWVDVSVRTAPAFDPKLGSALGIEVSSPVDLPSGCDTTLTAIHASGLTTELATVDLGSGAATVSWDGLADDGLALDPGEVQIIADLQCSERQQGFGEARTYVVRLGAGAIDFGVEGELEQQTLAWHKSTLLDRDMRILSRALPEYKQERPQGALADLDHDDGTPRPAPEYWDAPDVPPWGPLSPSTVPSWVVPAGYVAGSGYSVAFVPGTHAVSPRGGVAVPADGPLLGRDAAPVLRIVSDDLEPLDDGAWAPGRAAHFRSATPLPDTLGHHTLTLTWRFEALQNREWVPVPGEIVTEHPVWLLAGRSAVADGTDNGGAPGRVSWIGVLHDTQDAVQDLPASDPVTVMTSLRQHLHEDPYVQYNPNDSAYSTYQGRYIYWNRIWLDMSDWLDRQEGIDLYCHSMACLLSSQANHWGLEAEYITLVNQAHPETGATFRTWLTRAAGGEEWRQWTFNSHGIVELDGLVYDAAVDVDGDESPGELPATPWTPAGITFDEYMQVLTANDMVVVNRGKCENY